jgi:hypothetical protein
MSLLIDRAAFPQLDNAIRMNGDLRASAGRVPSRKTQRFQPASVEVIERTIRQSGMGEHWSCADEKP